MDHIYLTRQQVREVDRRAIQEYGIPGVVLMENASRNASRVALVMLRRRTRSALVLCGGGNNGGDGLAIARHLHNRNIDVQIAATVAPEEYKGDAAVNASIAQAMGLPIVPISPGLIAAWQGGLIVDAIFGTGLSRPPGEDFAALVQAVEKSPARVLAVDVPSGLDCDTGLPLGVAMRAEVTVTFVARKIGFANPASREYTGRVVVADIGVPKELIEGVR
jgi:NAD(P)H-hydrate epimerase